MTRLVAGLGLACLLGLAWTGSALAHEGHGVTVGFLDGLAHPFLGWDHVVAMVAVGLWGAFLGGSAVWFLPVVFPLMMVLGGLLAGAGIAVPAVEAGIAASGVVLGLLVALAVRGPLAVAASIVGVFAIFHGHAHGTSLAEAANPFVYAVGFVIGTAALHLVGIGVGLLSAFPRGVVFERALGGAIALAGAAFLVGMA